MNPVLTSFLIERASAPFENMAFLSARGRLDDRALPAEARLALRSRDSTMLKSAVLKENGWERTFPSMYTMAITVVWESLRRTA